MTENEQNIAIAEACKWKGADSSKMTDGYRWEDLVPSYTSDLNACHEAESTLTPTQWDDYDEWLYTLQGFDMKSMGRTNFHATAAKRAEAFLRTLNLWTE